MKKRSQIGLLVIFMMPLGVFASEIKVRVNGMVCGFCAQGITKKFKAEAEINNVDVKLANKEVTLFTKDGKDIADAKIESILKDSGYTVEKIQR